MTENPTYPTAIYFEPDGYIISENELVGRQIAGHSFLDSVIRDAVKSDKRLYGFTASERSYQTFQTLAKRFNHKAQTEWLPPHDLHKLASTSVLYLPDPNLEWAANLRLRTGIDAFSLCGVTHTTASHAVMDHFKNLLLAPVAPWDALVCTSRSVRASVDTVQSAQRDYLTWRGGPAKSDFQCQLPIIPLGIHTVEFDFDEKQRIEARHNLHISDEEVVFLYVGRLSPYTKAHPLAMYQGLEVSARSSEKKIHLIECGWTTDPGIDEMMDEALRAAAPSIRYSKIDGRDLDRRNSCFAAADVFVSLSDNIQETFGITPIEAMAAGLPLIVSDWDGYAELLINGEQGFKVPTYMPESTDLYALNHEAGAVFGRYCASVAQVTSIDLSSFVTAALALIRDKDLRKRMGESGRLRAKQVYDWSVVFGQYKELWADLEARRKHAKSDPALLAMIKNAPRCLPSRQAPSKLFSTYPTSFIGPNTRIEKDPDFKDRRKQLSLSIVDIGKEPLPHDEIVDEMFSALQNSSALTVADLQVILGLGEHDVQRLVGLMLKLGCVKIKKTALSSGLF